MFNTLSCGQVVYNLSVTLRTKCVQACGVLRLNTYTPMSRGITTYSYTGFNHFNHKFTHRLFAAIQSVKTDLYPLSTEPINTKNERI